MDVLSCTFCLCPKVGAFTEKPFRFKEKTVGSNIGVVIGVIVLLVSIGFVALMMISEWSRPEAQAPKSASVPAPRPLRASAALKPAAPKKKAAAKVPAKKKKAAKK